MFYSETSGASFIIVDLALTFEAMSQGFCELRYARLKNENGYWITYTSKKGYIKGLLKDPI